MHIGYTQLKVETKYGISLHDITPQIKSLLDESGINLRKLLLLVHDSRTRVVRKHTHTNATVPTLPIPHRRNGFVNVLSRHTTTSVVINENEARLVDDVRQYLLKLAPPDYPYLHNDIHLRSGPEDWPGIAPATPSCMLIWPLIYLLIY
eukprot:502930-Pyramimonas_sp.AAC.1